MDIVSLAWAGLMVVFTFSLSLSRNVGKKWTLEVLLIATIIALYQPVSIVLVF